MKIEVTQEDIDKGDKRNCCTCPIALALSRYSDKKLYLGCNIIYTKPFFLWTNIHDKQEDSAYKIVDLPQKAQHFIARFDSFYTREEVHPFSFNLSAECFMV